MKRRRLLVLLGSICLVSVLAALSFMAACAASAPAPAPAPAPTPAPAPAPAPTPAPAPAPQKVWKLAYAYTTSAGTPFDVDGSIPWADMVGEATKGRVKITTYPAGALCKGEDTWTAIKTGVADIAWVVTGRIPGQCPLSEVITLPFVGGGSGAINGRIVWKLYEEFPAIQAEYADVKLLGLFTTESYPLATVNEPIRTLEDIKGLKLRTLGGPPTEMTKALGAVPVMIGMPDTYLALQKGVVDGLWYSHESVLAFRHYEVTKYATDIPTSCAIFVQIMNQNLWDSFPPDIQEAIMSVSGEKIAEHFGSKVFDACKEILFARLAKEGIKWPEELITLSADEADMWVELGGTPTWNAWADKFKDRGPTQDILNRALELKEELYK